MLLKSFENLKFQLLQNHTINQNIQLTQLLVGQLVNCMVHDINNKISRTLHMPKKEPVDTTRIPPLHNASGKTEGNWLFKYFL